MLSIPKREICSTDTADITEGKYHVICDEIQEKKRESSWRKYKKTGNGETDHKTKSTKPFIGITNEHNKIKMEYRRGMGEEEREAHTVRRA